MALPVVTAAQMRRWEAASWEAGRSSPEVIAEAGRQTALRALEMSRPGDAVLVVAGPGNNGADARSAAPHLADRRVDLVAVASPAADLERIEAALARRPALVIDGLFGIGLNRRLDAAWLAVVDALNRAGRATLAVDVPSGLDADTGAPWGGAVRADLTLTFGAPKLGLCRPGAAAHTGRIAVASEVGLLRWNEVWPPAGPETPAWWSESEDFEGFPPARRVDAHKGDAGHAVLIAGSLGYHGAAVLAARGAWRARPGLVTVVTSPETYAPVAAQLAAAMVRPWDVTLELPPKATAIVAGPGLAAPDIPAFVRDQIRTWWAESPLAMVADASALDWLRGVRPNPSAVRVRTPHAGEAARLLDSTASAVQAGRWDAAASLGRDAWVILKGFQTLVGGPSGPLYINGSGNPGLAQGGSGDVLAGYLGGLLAQPAAGADPGRALRCAVWRHGEAADRLERDRVPWTAEDLALALR